MPGRVFRKGGRLASAIAAGTVVGLGLSAAGPAWATEGYFALGYSPEQIAQGGAGVANGDEAMSAAVNPAGVASVGNEYSMGLELFSPSRQFTGTGTQFVPQGTVKSGHSTFLIPNFAINKVLANGARLNFAAYGNGGMNTSYPDVANPACASFGGGSGVFCGGKAGVNLNQLFLSLTYAQKVGNLSFGISPTLALQDFSARGIGAFARSSVDGSHLSDQGGDWSHGFGLKAGVEYEAAPNLRFGLALQTKIKMSKFKKYAGLFADGGAFDIPASATLGLAWDARPDLTVMLDYQRIWYSGVPAVANPFPNGSAALGSANGPGFGWRDVDVIKLGAAWKASPAMTWRVGYAYSTNPVPPGQVTLNILAPGVVRSHFSAGGSWKMNAADTLDFAVEYVPRSSVSGGEVTTAGATPGTIRLSMSQVALAVGYTHRF
ncbi:OmpP1/FadL family transporter [Solirhodobacter olei]|uniref:OmpP1/FadL family transporter n=1 Tax=Solirhodobacter olei TaxID=2493082 RepID=UPI000FD79327|nr:outer membrane protein transport protein [Solirhodobacter olei]